MLEIFNNLFMSIAEQMGLRLQNTAYSVNIKERLDFSCAHLRRRRQPDRQRAAHAGAPRLDGREHQDGDARERRHDARRRRLHAQRSVQRRHAPARRDGDFAGVRRGRRQHPVLRRLARAPCRHRRHHARLDAARLRVHRAGGRLDRQFQAGRRRRRPAARCRGARLADSARATRRAIPTRTWPTCGRRWRPTRRASTNCARWSPISASTWCRPTWATCRTTRRKRCGA